MKFSDPHERDVVLGPLYATEAKTKIPVYGPEKFTSTNAKLFLNSTVKQALQSDANPVVNLLASTKPKMGQGLTQSDGSVNRALEKVQFEALPERGQGEDRKSVV